MRRGWRREGGGEGEGKEGEERREGRVKGKEIMRGREGRSEGGGEGKEGEGKGTCTYCILPYQN